MDTKLRALMSRDLVTVKTTDTMDWAHSLMSDKGIRHLPVIDENEAIVGILSDRDVKRAMRPDAPMDSSVIAGDYMSWPVKTIDEEQTVGAAARMMLDEKISALLILSSQKVIGIVTTEDLLRSIVEAHDERHHDYKEEFEAAIYNSPVGPIAQTLANAGI